jgi:(p)ppGpp synthase/HD superfamily hydrolase
MSEVKNEIRLWQKAASWAARVHQHQVRKDGQTPYIAHPLRVALTVRHVFECADAMAVTIALLHDVIEDTTTDFDDLCREFGTDVAEAVACLTKDKRLPEEQRESAYYAQLARSSWQVRLVKLADAFDNLCDALQIDRKKKAIAKARLALAAAGSEPQLEKARRELEALIAAVDADGEQAALTATQNDRRSAGGKGF